VGVIYNGAGAVVDAREDQDNDKGKRYGKLVSRSRGR
jgi:hypothetical protein